jgi:hypothetical protein
MPAYPRPVSEVVVVAASVVASVEVDWAVVALEVAEVALAAVEDSAEVAGAVDEMRPTPTSTRRILDPTAITEVLMRWIMV